MPLTPPDPSQKSFGTPVPDELRHPADLRGAPERDDRSSDVDASHRIVHWSYDSPWNPQFGGGGAQRDWEILRRLGPRWEVAYRVGGFPGAMPPVDRGGIEVEFLGKGEGRWGGRLAYARAAQLRARRSPPPDGIWSISPSVFAPVPAYLRFPDRTAVSLFHLVGWKAWSKYGPAGLLAIWHERQILGRMRHFLCINRTTADAVRAARPEARIEVVPTGFTPLLEVPSEGPGETILFFGRMDVYMKGLDRLLEAFALLASRRPQTNLVMAGRADRTVLERMEALVSPHPFRDRIRLEPNPDDARKASLFRSASVFCSPSRFEGWCIAAVEAQSCGLPVVASTADGFLDSVDDGVSGLLIPNDDALPGATATALESILANPDLARRLGEGGRAKAAGLTWESVASRHAQVFRSILDGAPT